MAVPPVVYQPEPILDCVRRGMLPSTRDARAARAVCPRIRAPGGDAAGRYGLVQRLSVASTGGREPASCPEV